MEMRLLVYLVERKDRLCRLRDILHSVWGTVGDTSRRTLNTHVNRLRAKLAGAGVHVETIRGVGLRLTEERPSRQLSTSRAAAATSRSGGVAQLTPLLPRAPAKASVSPRPL
jgi:DNA-binding winged helix-turn-helix (wHTH) protein